MPGHGGQTKFTAGGTLKVTNRLQCFPFHPVTRCRRGEWRKLLRCLISFENVFVLSIRRHKPCRPKACDHRHHLFRVYCPNGQPFLLPTSNVLIAQTSDRQSSTSGCSPTSVAAAACHGHGSSHHQPVQRTGNWQQPLVITSLTFIFQWEKREPSKLVLSPVGITSNWSSSACEQGLIDQICPLATRIWIEHRSAHSYHSSGRLSNGQNPFQIRGKHPAKLCHHQRFGFRVRFQKKSNHAFDNLDRNISG